LMHKYRQTAFYLQRI